MNEISNLVDVLKKLRYKEYKLFIGEYACIVYVIRFFNNEGLMSMLYKALSQMEYAEENNMIPYIDLQHFKNNYQTLNKKVNSWELFFSQPKVYSEMKMEDKSHKAKYIISSCLAPKTKNGIFSEYWANSFCNYKKKGEKLRKYLSLNPDIKKMADRLSEEMNIKSCVGVLARGTDYITLKPQGHPVQPTVSEISVKLHELDADKPNIFLVTEDENIKNSLVKEFGDRILIIPDDIQIENYKSGKLNKSIDIDRRIKVGTTYLLKIVLLSRCRKLVAGKTNGSLMALIMNAGMYEDYYLFEKGYY